MTTGREPGEELHHAVFALLHTPPSDHGFNRTSWKLSDLANVLRAQGKTSTQRNIGAVIKAAGYRWKQARVTLTSTDPNYREKLEIIRSTLSHLAQDEAFFSIDEFGPFAVKMRGGKSLCGPHYVRVVPQWQKSKGSLIVTAALELSQTRFQRPWQRLNRKDVGDVRAGSRESCASPLGTLRPSNAGISRGQRPSAACRCSVAVHCPTRNARARPAHYSHTHGGRKG